MPNKGYKQTGDHRKNTGIASKKFYREHPEGLERLSKLHSGKIPWNKGLTKETNGVLRDQSRKTKGRVFSKSLRLELSKAALKRIRNNPGPYKDTKIELKMKGILFSLNIPFEHQVKVEGINHLFDFRIKGTNVLVECDGDYFHRLPGRRKKDYRINRLAKSKGCRVLRFWEKDIMKNESTVVRKLEGEF